MPPGPARALPDVVGQLVQQDALPQPPRLAVAGDRQRDRAGRLPVRGALPAARPQLGRRHPSDRRFDRGQSQDPLRVVRHVLVTEFHGVTLRQKKGNIVSDSSFEELRAEIESIHETILRTQAVHFALESLVLAMFDTAPNKADLIRRFHEHGERLIADQIADVDHPDEVFQVFEQAHANIAKLLQP